MADHHYIKAHSPFMLTGSGKYLLAVCGDVSEADIREEISCIFDASIATLRLLIHEHGEDLAALWGLAYLIKTAQGLNENLQ